jgi:hypothetical protein
MNHVFIYYTYKEGKPREVCGDAGTQYGKLKKYIISFLLKKGKYNTSILMR